MKNKITIKFIAVFANLLMHSAVFSAVNAYLDQATFYEGDPITLTVISTINNNAKPDISPLQRSFEILGSSTNSQTNIINGSRSFKRSWTIDLQAKVKGKLLIPEIIIGNEKTKAIELIVIDLPPEVKAETGKHISVEATIGVSGDRTYVQQQIPYKVKFIYDASMLTGEISQLDIENAVTEQLGRDKRYQITRAGKRLTVVEKSYVISPEKSGSLHIPAVIVKGRIALSGGDSRKLRKRMDETDMLNKFFSDFSNDPFFNDGFFKRRSQGPSKPFTASSKVINVEILPVPDAFTGRNWLPAESLSIEDSWAKKPPNFKVGEPVTRKLILQVKGLAGSQIPDLVLPNTKNIKIYSETPKSETRTDGKTVYGIQQLEVTYIPSKQGEVVIPPLDIDWWNVKTKKQQTFTLPKWHLSVAAGEQEIQQEYQVEQPSVADDESSNTEELQSEIPVDSKETSFSLWMWFLLWGFILLLAILWLIFRKRKVNIKYVDGSKNTLSISQLRAALITACDNNDKKEAVKALISFVRLYWGDSSIHNLGVLAKSLDSGADIINELEQSLYAEEGNEWQGNKLKQLVTSGLNKIDKQTKLNKYEGLTPLYPN